MNGQNPMLYPPQQPKKPLSWHLKRLLKDCISNVGYWWCDLPLMRKLFWLVAIFIPAITMPLSHFLGDISNPVVDIIHILAGISELIILFLVYRLICGMLFSDGPTRRKLYCLIMAFLWLIYGYCYFFVDDPDIKDRMFIMAGIGSIWLFVPIFFSFWTIIYHHDDH